MTDDHTRKMATKTKEAKETKEMKEMVGGCCVCSDERGWPENPLVYCDGKECMVAVHQACYGITSVPSGPWFCFKCDKKTDIVAQCVLCPWKDGALKRTDQKNAAHVVCALYIPEIRFGNVSTMEPIILELVPQERYGKTCYICLEKGKGSKANVGACMQCNKAGCKLQFHVTCAQTLGLLCEEAGTYLDNVKYCGYCESHYNKAVSVSKKHTKDAAKSTIIKTIPPYQPEGRADLSDPPSSPEKETDPSTGLITAEPSTFAPSPSSSSSLSADATDSKSSQNGSQKSQRKSANKAAKSSSSTQLTTPASSKQSVSNMNTSTSSSNLSSDTLNASGTDGVHAQSNTSTKESHNSSSSGKSSNKSSSSRSSSSSSKSSSRDTRESKHSKGSRHQSKDSPAANDHGHSSSANTSNNSSGIKHAAVSPTETVLVTPDSMFAAQKSPHSQTTSKKRKVDTTRSSGAGSDRINRDGLKDISVTLTPLPFDKHDYNTIIAKKKCTESDIIQSTHTAKLSSTIIRQSEDLPHRSASGLGIPLPITPATIIAISAPCASTPSNQIPTIKSIAKPESSPPADLLAKDPLYLGDKPTLSSAIVRNPSPLPTTSMEGKGLKITIKAPSSLSDDISMARVTSTPDDDSNPFSDLKITYEAQPNVYESATLTPRASIKSSPPSSPTSDTIDTSKANHPTTSSDSTKDLRPKEVLPTHMLGNQLNPASSVAQKMSDQLFMEMEANNGGYVVSNVDTIAPLVGPAFPGKQSNAIRSAPAPPQALSLASMLSGNAAATAHGNTPQSLEQLLERQWEQGSQFLMEQAQHFDIASLLSCLHQLRSENVRLEDHVNNLVARRDHLLAVNARLAIPLNSLQQPQNPNANAAFNTLHLNGSAEPSPRSRSHNLK